LLLPCSFALQPLIVPRVIAELSSTDLMYPTFNTTVAAILNPSMQPQTLSYFVALLFHAAAADCAARDCRGVKQGPDAPDI
jgi:hypothetical protein